MAVRHALSFEIEANFAMIFGNSRINNQESFLQIKAGDLVEIAPMVPLHRSFIPSAIMKNGEEMTKEAASVLMAMISSPFLI